jgi:hypothetical protein
VLRIKAYFLLLIFAATTATSFASVHQCGGEITDIDFLSAAECEHVKVSSCHSEEKQCCHDESEDSDSANTVKDCCSTSQLNAHQSNVVNENENQVYVKELLILKSIFIDVYTSQLIVDSFSKEIDFKLINRDYFALYQRYII